jgi:hypothetical protein
MSYRKIHDLFWTDPDIEELSSEQKYFYLYLLTNPSVNQIGLYGFSLRRAEFETGLSQSKIQELVEFFENLGKIKRSKVTKELLVVKFWSHNKSNSPKLKKHVEELINLVKDKVLIQYIYSMDTESQEEKEEEEKKEIEEDERKKKNNSFERGDNFSIPTIEQCRQAAEMSGHDLRYGDAYFHMRNADEWLKARGKGEFKQMVPIGNWRSDYITCKNESVQESVSKMLT